jgi:competence protein ComEA
MLNGNDLRPRVYTPVFNSGKVLYSAIVAVNVFDHLGPSMQSRHAKLIAAGIIVSVVFAVVMTINRSERSRDLVLQIEPIDPSDDITVYVGGAVEDPGLFSIARGSRVAEVLELAGLRDDADTSGLPLAESVRDEQSITVPELQDEPDSIQSTMEQSPASAATELIDINRASVNELQGLPGIGPALAERIVEQRDHEGPFQSLDELSDVSGISDRMVDEIREYVTLGQ